MQRLIQGIEGVTAGIGVVSSWLILPLVLALCYEVFVRYVLGQPTIWAFDITYMLTASIFLTAAAHTLAHNRHIRIDVFYGNFSATRKAWVDLTGYLVLFLPVIALLAYFSIGNFFDSIRRSETSDLSPWHPVMWPFRMAIALCFCLLLIQGICEVLKSVVTLTSRKQGEKHG
ncbi:MAG: TRAP transporter small permease subunit [Betaproteobacteria bacterium]|nr:TRAP transporter small permease subunit [Betaproteobacteria bacterium]